MRSEIYLECLPVFTRGLVSLPDHAQLLRELRLLERHTHRSGRDTVDHGKHGSDDYSNSACGVLRLLSRSGEDWLSRWGPALYGRDEWDKMKDDVYARIEEENRAREARYANSR